jgi:hypothetical protein
MIAKLQPILIVGVVAILAVSCSKTNSKPPAAPPHDTTGQTTPGGPGGPKTTDVYVCGSDSGNAVYWKNGQEVRLSFNGAGEARSIFVHDTDVYVAGSINNAAISWKNGKATVYEVNYQGVPSTNTYLAPGIFYADSTYYVAIDQHVATNYIIKEDFYEVTQPSGASEQKNVYDLGMGPTLNSIFVSGTDVYLAGAGLQSTGENAGTSVMFEFASYYKNGNEHFLPQDQSLISPGMDYVIGQATGIAVSGNDVYTCGWGAAIGRNDFLAGNDAAAVPIYWKNDSVVVLQGNYAGFGITGKANSICLQGSDVYISGYAFFNDNFYNAAYWKNGTITALGDQSSSGNSIGVSPAGDVYVAGDKIDNNNNNTAVLWKNGAATQLGTAGNSAADAVFVYTH